MKKITLILLFIALMFDMSICLGNILPNQFVYLKTSAPDIIEDIRYASSYNFVGRPIQGYNKGYCILTKPAALALSKVENELIEMGLTLKVYDCYRPKQAVMEFYKWSQNNSAQEMKNEFFPRIPKNQLFNLSYIALYSGHSRGSTVDLTLVPYQKNASKIIKQYKPVKATRCFAPYHMRFDDGSLDMGTNFDCLDPHANISNHSISIVAQHNRILLQKMMKKYGFEPYEKEWWHFTLKNEPYPKTYFDFPIE